MKFGLFNVTAQKDFAGVHLELTPIMITREKARKPTVFSGGMSGVRFDILSNRYIIQIL